MELWQWLILIITGAIAIRFTFKFDLNRFLEKRREIKMERLKNICPHGKIIDTNGNRRGFESYFHSPRGTFNWTCRRCNLVIASEEDVKRMAEGYARDPKRFLKNEKKFVKGVRRLGLS